MNIETQLLHLESKLDLIIKMLKITDHEGVYSERYLAYQRYLEEPHEDEE